MKTRVIAAGLLALSLLAGASSASNLDKALLTRCADILDILADKGFRTVGVLPFRVQKGARPAGYDAAPMATSLPARLENALIVGQVSDEDKAVRVIRNALGTAARAGIGAWATDRDAYRKLFSTRYALAWGDERVTPDAFLTGIVIHSPANRRETAVAFELLTPDSWKDGKAVGRKIGTLRLGTDRGILRDLGYAYALKRSTVRARGIKAIDLDKEALLQTTREENGAAPPPGTATTSHSPDNVGGMRFEIEYDGVKQEIVPLAGGANARQPTFQVPAARPGQKVVMYLQRVAEDDSKLGVVLSVNGKSVYEQQDGDKLLCKKWIYASGKKGRDDFTGFYFREGGKLVVREFEALTAEKSRELAAEMGARAGWIDIDVFVSGPARLAAADQEPVFSTRGASLARGRTMKQVQETIAKANNLKLVAPDAAARSGVKSRSGGLLHMGSVPLETAPVSTDELRNPREIGGISIRYYENPVDGGGKVID